MRAFAKTLFGDRYNLIAVAGILLFEAVLAVSGTFAWAALSVPVAVLAAVAWLARH